MAFMGLNPNSYLSLTHKITKLQTNLFSAPSSFSSKFRCTISGKASISSLPVSQNDVVTAQVEVPSSNSFTKSTFSGLEEVITGYLFGKKKATEVAHAMLSGKGTLLSMPPVGNGYDTLALLRLIADGNKRKGRVLAMDLQKGALESASSLLDRSVSADERKLVELYALCHSKMEELVPNGDGVRLVAFNLGYLPGGDKKIKTESETTILALEAAKKILSRGGLISILSYVGHAGGREEFVKVESFAAELPVDNWVCCKLQTVNRPLAPILVLLSKK